MSVMPAMVTIFDKKCNPLLELGTGPYNTIRWNPKGKCILEKNSEMFYFILCSLSFKLVACFILGNG